MRLLASLLEDVEVVSLHGNGQLMIREIAIDSRKAGSGDVFIAIPGTKSDGHMFIDKAVENGVKVIVCERLPDKRSADVTWVQVKNAAAVAGTMAHNYYGKPSQRMQLVGITGTNGKTTVSTLLYRVFHEVFDIHTGLISTVEYRIGDTVIPATHTTPDPLTLNRVLAEMVAASCRFCFMEVSSHAIVQERIHGLQFSGGVFTNISHDHLDYHGDFASYIKAKKKFFDELDTQAFALINADDPRSPVMVQNTRAKVSKFSLQKHADFKARILASGMDGLHLRIDEMEMHSTLVGAFNAYNILTAYATAICLGMDRHEVITALSGLGPVAGRFDSLSHPVSRIHAVVDYAHTPDALQKVMEAIVTVLQPPARLIVVVGCGGDRDRQKRPVMGRIAAAGAHIAILTSDNPRSEDPVAILDEMMAGIASEDSNKVFRNTDRREAIRMAVRMASAGDTILIAGKGHEKYQEINGVKHPFDDKKIVQDALFEDI